MAIALDGLEDSPPEMPEGLAQARIDPDSGLLAYPDNPSAIMEVFQAGVLPPMEQPRAEANEDVPTEEDPYQIY